MIERHWKGVTKPDRDQEYIEHLENKTFVHLKSLSGFRSTKILARKLDHGTEFLIISVWDNLDSITQFSGSDYEKAVVPKEAAEMMVHFDSHVTHYEVKSEK